MDMSNNFSNSFPTSIDIETRAFLIFSYISCYFSESYFSQHILILIMYSNFRQAEATILFIPYISVVLALVEN